MRFGLIALAVLFTAKAVQADDATEARALIEKSVKAMKWEDSSRMTWKDKGVIHVGGMKLDYTSDWALDLPGKMRFHLKAKIPGFDLDLLQVANGDKIWERMNESTNEVTGEKKDGVLTNLYQQSVMSLTPLLSDKEFTFKLLPEIKVDEKACAGIEVTHKDRSPMKLYFDKSNSYLMRAEFKSKDEFQGFKEVNDVATFGSWTKTGERMSFTQMKLVRDGNLLIESELSDHKVPKVIDAKLFEKP